MRVDLFITHVILAISAVMGFLFFDNTIAGFVLAMATAIAGPVAEIVLINVPHLYSYTHADVWGICSWIPWVYFLGIHDCIIFSLVSCVDLLFRIHD